MATFANAFQATGRTTLPSLSSLFISLRALHLRAAKRRQIVRELNSHSDRQLADMGIARADIPHVARGGTRR